MHEPRDVAGLLHFGQASRKNRLYLFSPIRGGCRSCTMTSRKGRMNVRALKEP